VVGKGNSVDAGRYFRPAFILIEEKMGTESTGKNSKKKKFQQTRQLIGLALNDGWTQTQIAKACRVHQSMVSSWKNGASKATEAQLYPLLEVYGHKLRRNTFRVYWSISQESSNPIFHKVEGKIILSQSFSDPRRHGHKLIKKIPTYKLVIHDQGKGKFRVVQQKRFIFQHSNEELECSQEDAIWNSTVGDQISAIELLNYIDNYCQEVLREFPSDANTLPYLIRKALLNHGHHVEGVVDYPAVW
jgi:transcriptional regulator with XRE-family HTH domain